MRAPDNLIAFPIYYATTAMSLAHCKTQLCSSTNTPTPLVEPVTLLANVALMASGGLLLSGSAVAVVVAVAVGLAVFVAVR
jgi:hypothetical protein